MACLERCFASFSADAPFPHPASAAPSRSWDQDPATTAAPRTIYVDIIETSDEIEILADIPGLHKEDIAVDIDRNSVTLAVDPPAIRRPPPGSPPSELRFNQASSTHPLADPARRGPWPGATASAADQGPLRAPGHATPAAHAHARPGSIRKVHCSERSSSFARRSLVLPESAELKRASASYREGVLQILIPKRQGAPGKRLRVM